MKRPLGIWVCVALMAEGVLRHIFGAARYLPGFQSLSVTTKDIALLYWSLALVAIYGVLLWGIFGLRPWARFFGVVLAVFAFFQGGALFFEPVESRLLAVPRIIIALILLYLLGFEKETKESFRAESLF
ncbi:MAG: hypothetical protein ACREJQ_00945 [bacterium]